MVLAEAFASCRRAARQGGRGAQLRAGGAHPLAGERAPDAAQGDRGGARAVHAVGDVLEGARVPRAARDHQQEREGHPRSARRAGREGPADPRSQGQDPGAGSRAARSGRELARASSATWSPPTSGSRSWRRTARSRPSARRRFKARLDDAHEELRKAREEIDGLKKRMAQEEAARAARTSACAPTPSRGWRRPRRATAPSWPG